MPVVYAGVVPHAPLLLPTVAKDHQQLLAITRQQLEMMAEELHARQPDILVLLTPHGGAIPGTVSIDVADMYRGRLAEFGDITTDLQIAGAPAIVHRLREVAEKAEVPVAFQTASQLEYGSTVPLYFFQQPGSTFRLIPISVAEQSVATLLRFGAVLHEFFHLGPERYAVLASADLERRSKKKSSVTSLAAEQRATPNERQLAVALTKLDPSIIAGMDQSKPMCGFNPILTLLASLQPTAAHGRMTSFEAPFGVGQMTATIDISS